jgi:hypothetical protein
MHSICNIFLGEMANYRLLLSLTPGFSRVWLVGRPVGTVSTVFNVMPKTVETVFNLPGRTNTLLKQGAHETECRTFSCAPKGAN